MKDRQDLLNQLLEKLEELTRKQDSFNAEVEQLKTQIEELRWAPDSEPPDVPEIKADVDPPEKSIQTPPKPEKPEEEKPIFPPISVQPEKPEPSIAMPVSKPKTTQSPNTPPRARKTPSKSSFEKFIGENLFNKIGILITVIGVGIGAKYAIDHQMISPVTRIVLGYIVGIGLLGFAFKLRKKYENFSAVLLSGSMATLYFVTFSAYAFLDLIPQLLAFVLMVVYTAFTVFAAMSYNRVIIAHIGLVGAYAVPFLLSDGSGRVHILLSYIAIINAGILFLAFKRAWKSLYFVAFGLTWLIFMVFLAFDYRESEHFTLALAFSSIFFLLFYGMSIAYKVVNKVKFNIGDAILILLNSFIYFGLGVGILSDHDVGENYIGAFAVINAIIHFAVASLLSRRKTLHPQLFFFAAGLVLVFATIAIPIELDGNWVTLLWAAEALLMFWLGRVKKVKVYEFLSYPLMVLTLGSLLQDWGTFLDPILNNWSETWVTPVFNISFLSTALVIVAFAMIHRIFVRSRANFTDLQNRNSEVLLYLLPATILTLLYAIFFIEIVMYWEQLKEFTMVTLESGSGSPDRQIDHFLEGRGLIHRNPDIPHYLTMSLLNYSLLFTSILAVVNLKKMRNYALSIVNVALLVIGIAMFLLVGSFSLYRLLNTFMGMGASEYFHHGAINWMIRYLSYLFLGLGVWAVFRYLRTTFQNKGFVVFFDLLLHFVIITVLSMEFVQWMSALQFERSFKLGVSILWGTYSLGLIVMGIRRKKAHLRLSGMALFGVTLIKLILWDLSHLNTIAKTIIFVSLGALLLVISFLYNKYKPNEEEIDTV